MQTTKETNHEIKTKRYTFSLVSDTDVKKSCFFYADLKSLINSFNFSQFHEHIFRNSRLQMFFKIGVLKNIAIFGIKKRLRRRFFSVNIAKILRTDFL